VPPFTAIFITNALLRSLKAAHRLAAPQGERRGSFPERPTGNKKQILRPRATQVADSRRALRRTAESPGTITFAGQDANAPILIPDIPAMIATAMMVLMAMQTPQR
jgi:hypothetical protein